MQISKDPVIIDRILTKAVEDILPTRAMLEEQLNSGKRLKIYQGFDPTADSLHIGHTVMMRKLEDFRKLGHEVIFLMGNFTGAIGDPSDKKATRQQLTVEQTNENLKAYKQQASAIIDVDNSENPVTILYNYDWLANLTFEEVIKLASEFTVQQMLKRSMFQKRLEDDKPIGLHEFLYPLMQGYDSVAMDVDIEVGGNDQLFNMLAGRTLQKALQNKEKIVIAGKLLATADGTKMGKSEGNMIKLSDSARDIYGKVMAFPDEHIVSGFELLTSAEMSEVSAFGTRISAGENPMILKKELAFRLTKELKGETEAQEAKKFFEDAFQKREVSEDDLETVSLKPMDILSALVEAKIASSKGVARRLVQQNAVSLDGDKVKSVELLVDKSTILRVGKKIVKLLVSAS